MFEAGKRFEGWVGDLVLIICRGSWKGSSSSEWGGSFDVNELFCFYSDVV